MFFYWAAQQVLVRQKSCSTSTDTLWETKQSHSHQLQRLTIHRKSKTSIIWQLLGVPAGFVGHGEGGLLTPIMEKPNAVVLFDEFEKADPSVGKLLLQIIDTGLQEDNMGNTLDFRRSIILFTSNLGVDYGSKTKRIGFGDTKPKKSIPKVDEEKLRSELKLMGYGPEFLARVHEIFLYKSLDGEAISNILEIQVEKLKEIFKARKLIDSKVRFYENPCHIL